uniref:hypothetical protein n=1 Tax=Thaumasiovibrio occultus TaxID=1891184 RepID=UPI000B35E73D|nr:hypothetical protein [Thaumasiovibrio occultus]
MKAEEFVSLVKENSRDFAIDWAEGSNIGVSKEAQLWANNLTPQHKRLLREILSETVDISLINLFEIMDGVHSTTVEPVEASIGSDKISGQGCKQLHDLYASKI